MSDPYAPPPPPGPPPPGWGPPPPGWGPPPPGWGPPPGWYPPAPGYATPYDRPQPYHRVLVTRRARWWRPAVALVVFLASYALLALLAFVPWFVTSWRDLAGAASAEAAMAQTEQMTPLFLLSTNLSLAVAIPAACLGLLAGAQLRPGWLASVAGRFRWDLLARATGLAVAVVVAVSALGWLLPGGGDGAAAVPGTSSGTFAAYAAVVLLTTPLQAAGEEYAFRGLLLQVVGAWVRRPLVGGLVSATLFALAHGSQNLPLFLDRFAFGLVAWWLVMRTGGLEASIALHAANNAVVFLVAAAFGQVGESLAVTEAPWAFVLLDLVQLGAYAWLVEVLLVRRRAPAVLTRAG